VPGSKSNNPGPGTYDSNYNQVRQSQPATSLGLGNRNNLGGNSKSPGPGTYDADLTRNNSGPKFGSSARDGPLKPDQMPGPGQYEVNNDYTRHNSGKTMGAKLDMKANRSTLGPGAYDANYNPVKRNFGAVTMKSRHNELSKSMGPGPGSYEITKSKTTPQWG